MRRLPAEVRALLVCPRCHGELAGEPQALRCDACRLRYRIERGIPVLLVSDAVSLDEERSSRG
jgi:uncharacterized protein